MVGADKVAMDHGVVLNRLLGSPDYEFAQGTLLAAACWDYALSHVAHSPNAPSPPSLDDLHAIRPHPHAYFSHRVLGWHVITPWPPSSAQKPPKPAWNKGGLDCPAKSGHQPTHRFVTKPKSIDPKLLNDLHVRPEILPNSPTDKQVLSFDAIVCSQCGLAVARSPEGFIPSILGPQNLSAFEHRIKKEARARVQAEGVDKARIGSEIVVAWQQSLHTLFKMIDALVINGNAQALPAEGNTFKKRLGWYPETQAMFEILGFKRKNCKDYIAATGQTASPSKQEQDLIEPPSQKDPSFQSIYKPRLLRAWLELAIIISIHLKRTTPGDRTIIKTHIPEMMQLRDPTDTFKEFFGGKLVPEIYDPSSGYKQVGAKSSDSLYEKVPEANSYKYLGIVPKVTDEIVLWAYKTQKASNPYSTPRYWDALQNIALSRDSKLLKDFVKEERKSPGIISAADINKARQTLGLPTEGTPENLDDEKQMHLALTSFFDATPDEVVADQFNQKMEANEKNKSVRADLRKALLLLAEMAASDFLKIIHASTQDEPPEPLPTVQEAYDKVQVATNMDDATIITIYEMNLGETSLQKLKDRLKVCLKVIGEARNSKRILKYVETGVNEEEWQPLPVVSKDQPVGIQNIGNTCYLNSLLQYFFTLKPLRETIISLERLQESDPDSTNQQVKKAGGRYVTAAEVVRSKRFASELAQLFNQLTLSSDPSVRPELALAYLALVSSKDEESGTITSPLESIPVSILLGPIPITLSATDQPATASSPTDARSPSSVLGKRKAEDDEPPASEMDVDTPASANTEPLFPDKPDDTMVDATKTDDTTMVDVANEGLPQTPAVANEPSVSKTNDGVVEIRFDEEKKDPPALPPRPDLKELAKMNNGAMMFGKQNDVAEAMDNVMFQIEAALDGAKVAKEMSKPEGEDFNLVQELFRGRTIQTLELPDSEARRIKEETFNYLLIDVAVEGKDLYDGLDAAFEMGTVEIEGKQAKRTVALSHLPPVLQLQLQRVQFDRATSRVFKSQAYMPFPLNLSMDRYMQPVDEASTERHVKSSALRSELDTLQAESLKLSTPKISEKLSGLASFLDELDKEDSPFKHLLQDESMDTKEGPSSSTAQDLVSLAKDIENSISKSQERIKELKTEIQTIWEGEQKPELQYELASVFMHRGEANFGHYWLYQRALPAHPDKWFKFNDETVSIVPSEEVLADTKGSTANPYWLAYVRKTEDNVVDAVHRILPD